VAERGYFVVVVSKVSARFDIWHRMSLLYVLKKLYRNFFISPNGVVQREKIKSPLRGNLDLKEKSK
jgi:hypothetical protein